MNTRTLLHIILYVCCVALMSCRHSFQTVDGEALGTTFHVVTDSPLSSGEIYSGIMDIDRRMKASMSIFSDSSLLSKINRGETDEVDEHIKSCLEAAGELNRLSQGKYDVTVKPLTDAYGFVNNGHMKTGDIKLDSLLEFVGFDLLKIEGNRLVKGDPRVQIDLNSIAKGYTVDRIAEFLEQSGSENYLVEVGGEIHAKGHNPHNIDWRISVDSPFDGNMNPGQSSQAVLSISSLSLATSGNYRRFYLDENGEKITHTIDPKTGHSISSRLLSATVITEGCMRADGMATMFMALGADKAIELAREMKDIQVYFILASGDNEGGYEIFSTLEK